MSKVDFCDICECTSYLLNFWPKIDSTALGLPGEQGKEQLIDLKDKLYACLKEINQRRA
jgi:hypothetical protein